MDSGESMDHVVISPLLFGLAGGGSPSRLPPVFVEDETMSDQRKLSERPEWWEKQIAIMKAQLAEKGKSR